MSNPEFLYALWALPAGKFDRLDEQPLTSFALTQAQATLVQEAAAKDGWHGFRLVPETHEQPVFTFAGIFRSKP